MKNKLILLLEQVIFLKRNKNLNKLKDWKENYFVQIQQHSVIKSYQKDIAKEAALALESVWIENVFAMMGGHHTIARKNNT